MTTHTQVEAKSTSALIPAMQPTHSGLLPQQEQEEPERSSLSSEDRLRSPSSPTPPPINPSAGHSFGSMAIGSTTSPVLQRMAIANKNLIQRQENTEEEEEETVQAKTFPGQGLTHFIQRYGHMVTQAKVRSVPGVPVLQRKLAIGQPNDQYEQEADRVADQVMRMPAPKIQRLCPECKEELQRQPMAEEEKKKEDEETLQTKSLAESITPLIQRQTEPTEEEKKKKEEETLQTKPASGAASTASPALQNQITALQGGGQPLPESERHFFEPRFGTDFSQVRVHADGQAAEAARAVNARAFTLGRDVVFGAGEYQPRSLEGQRLIAHELTHIVQQSDINEFRPNIQRKPENEAVDQLKNLEGCAQPLRQDLTPDARLSLANSLIAYEKKMAAQTNIKYRYQAGQKYGGLIFVQYPYRSFPDVQIWMTDNSLHELYELNERHCNLEAFRQGVLSSSWAAVAYARLLRLVGSGMMATRHPLIITAGMLLEKSGEEGLRQLAEAGVTDAQQILEEEAAEEEATWGIAAAAIVEPLPRVEYPREKAPSPPMDGSRQTAIDRAWKQEVDLIKKTGRGSRPWTQSEINRIKNGASYKDLGYTGHHINPVQSAKDWKGDPRNIDFMKQGSGEEHMTKGHPGGTKAKQPPGKLIDREQMLKNWESSKGAPRLSSQKPKSQKPKSQKPGGFKLKLPKIPRLRR